MPNERPQDLIDRRFSDRSLPASNGEIFPLRAPGRGPLVLFFYARNASPG